MDGDCGYPESIENHDGAGAETGSSLSRKEKVVGGHLYGSDGLDAMQIVGEGRVDGDTNVDKLGDLVDEERGGRKWEISPYYPLGGTSGRAVFA